MTPDRFAARRARLGRIARLLDVACDVLEEREGWVVEADHRAAVRAVAAWSADPAVDLQEARNAAYAAGMPDEPAALSTANSVAFYLVSAALYVQRGKWEERDGLTWIRWLRGAVEIVARAAFGDRGDALVREAWEGPC